MKLIDKDLLKEELNTRIEVLSIPEFSNNPLMVGERSAYLSILSFLDTLEVIDPYEECVQYSSIKAGIQAHAETYSFNIESELFNQLSKEQQGLWRKEIEQACISGGEVGVELAKDPRYKENVEVKEVDLDESARHYLLHEHISPLNEVLHQADLRVEMQYHTDIEDAYKAGFELGIKTKGNKKLEE